MLILSENEISELVSIIGAYINEHGGGLPDKPVIWDIIQMHLDSMLINLEVAPVDRKETE